MGGILKIGKSEMFLHAQPQPRVLVTNGGHSWIQRVK